MRRFLQQQNIRTILLVTLTVIYMLLGAVVFSALEEQTHKKQTKEYISKYNELRSKYNMSDKDLDDLIKYLHKRRHLNNWALEPWSFAGSVYFTSATITTIGYGHSVPQTTSGMVFLVVYALFGIPLNLTMFQAIGERMGVFFSYLLRRVKRFLHMKNTDVPLAHLATFGLLIWLVFLMVGALLFAHYESWTYFRSLYYFFVTLTTIGFGDMVALQEIKRNDPSNKALHSQMVYVAATLIVIYIGLIFCSTVINLLVMRLMELQQPKRKRKTISWNNGPRCNHCKHKNTTSEDNSTILENESMTILQNFEEEISFTSYKQVHENSIRI